MMLRGPFVGTKYGDYGFVNKVSDTREVVVLIHGLAANRLVMAPLARNLAPHYARVINWGYPSIWHRIERNAENLAALLGRLHLDDAVDRIHLVTHSMGGIVTRCALQAGVPKKLGQVVMIAPPNQGSHVAKALAPWLGGVCPPLVQLADQADSFVLRLPAWHGIPLGVIAASRDFMVREANTRMAAVHDHIRLPGMHSSVLWRRVTADQVRHFLLHRRFNHTGIRSAA